MSRRTLVAALATAVMVLPVASAAALPGARPAARPAGLHVTGWILGSGKVSQVDRNAGGLSTLSVDGVLLHGHAGITRPDAQMLRLARRAHRDGLRSELLVSNYSNARGDFDPVELHRLLSHPASIATAARRVATAAARGPWDGVNVDFELVRRADATGLASFVRHLQAAMPARLTVSVDVSAATSVAAYRARGYALTRLRHVADVIDVMTYDYSGPTWTGPGPIAPLSWQRKALAALLQRVPAGRVQLGVAGYGYTWPTHGTGRDVTDAGARGMVRRDGATARWDSGAGEWTATLSNGTVLWWSDARSYRLRTRLARSQGLRGVAVWRVGSADRLR